MWCVLFAVCCVHAWHAYGNIPQTCQVCALAEKVLEAGPAATHMFSAMRVRASTSGRNPARRLNRLYGLTATSSKLYYSRVPLRGVKDGKVEMTWMPFNLPHEVLAKLWQQNPADFLHHQHSAQHLPPLLRETGAAQKLFLRRTPTVLASPSETVSQFGM
jgi:hypothetical protein